MTKKFRPEFVQKKTIKNPNGESNLIQIHDSGNLTGFFVVLKNLAAN